MKFKTSAILLGAVRAQYDNINELYAGLPPRTQICNQLNTATDCEQSTKVQTGYIQRIGLDSPIAIDSIATNDLYTLHDQLQDKIGGVDGTKRLVAGALFGIQYEQALIVKPLLESDLLQDQGGEADKPLNQYGPMKIYSSLTFTDIADYDHEAGVFPTLVWQVPADAVPGQEFYVGDFSTDAEGQVFWNIIKIIVEAHETNADFSSEVSRLYTQWEEVTFSTMREADRFFDETNEETEVQHIGIFERDMEFPANGVSMPVLTAADEAQYLNDNRLVTVGEVCKVGRCAGDTNLYEPTDYVVDNIVTYTVQICSTVVFYLNFDWNMQNDWMVYQNYELPVTAFVDTYIVETGSYRMAYAVEIPCDEAYWEERLNEGKNYNFADEHFMRIVQGANNAELSSWQRRIDISLVVEGLDVFEVEPEEIEDVIWSKNTVQNIQIVFAVILFVGFFMIIG